jgi:putative flippase GtrA
MIAVKYVVFAVIATALNLLFQFISFHVYNGFASLYAAMAVGTAAGLLCKYFLDKKYVFLHKSVSKKRDALVFFSIH